MIAVALLLCGVTSVAQNLSKEITLEKDIIPQKREVSRMTLSPRVLLPQVKAENLQFSEQHRDSSVEPQLAFLEPASYADSLPYRPNRGYVDLGYFPAYNASLSAGYRIIDEQSTSLNAWMQYNGKKYDGQVLNEPLGDVTMRSHDVSLGMKLGRIVGGASLFKADVEYAYSRFRVPFGRYLNGSLSHFNQSVNRLGITLGWKSSAGKIDYDACLRYGYFSFAEHGLLYPAFDVVNGISPVRENSITLDGQVSYLINENARAGVDVDVSCLDYNRDYDIAEDAPAPQVINGLSQPDYGIIALTPRLDYAHDNLSARLGARIDVAVNSGTALHIAPDISVDWSPVRFLSVYGQLGGGLHLNNMLSLYDEMQHMSPMIAYNRSSVPLKFDLGAVVGSWRGASVKVYGRYAKADGWLMPVVDGTIGYFSPVNIDGWLFGVSARYSYRKVAELCMTYETAPQKIDKGYYMWRDRARNVMELSLKVSPLDALDVTVAYRYRGDRRAMQYEPTAEMVDLGDMSNLSIGAKYSISEALSVWLNLENILGTDYHLLSGLPAQGFSGLVGAGYKF